MNTTTDTETCGSADAVIVNGAVTTMDPTLPEASAIALSGGAITYVGDDPGAERHIGAGTSVIDAAGHVVAPGFIDIHSHTDLDLFADPANRLFKSYLMQGITTVITGNCGLSAMDTKTLLGRVETIGPAVNFGALIGHGYVREVCGVTADRRIPTGAQSRAMLDVIDDAMRNGAFGLSSGLEYIPGLSAETRELIECAKVVARHRGLYATHMRSEGDALLASVEEAIRIGVEANVRVEISHIKSDGRCNWWKTAPAIAMIEAARADGVDVALDQYPYVAFGWNPTIFIDGAHLEAGRERLIDHVLRDAARRAEIKAGIVDRMCRYHGGDGERVIVFDWTDGAGRHWAGCSLAEILTRRNTEPSVENAAELILEMVPDERPDSVMGCDISTSDPAVETYLRLPYGAICTDGFHQRWMAPCHPRHYGAFPRVLGTYVRDKKVISQDLAIRKMTAVPAAVLGLEDRGVIRTGTRGDIVVFDPQTVADNATFVTPAPPSGIDFVFVNGVLTVDARTAVGGPDGPDGFVADALPVSRTPGMVLRGPGYQAR